MALKGIIDDLLARGRIRPSMSPWNTPVFVIKKPSGKWRMLQDLRKINDRMEITGAPLRGMPWVPAIPTEFHLAVIDLKDCFFSIPLHPEDCHKFAFSVPSTNFACPDQRYEWVVLPQVMANSLAFCQNYLATLLQDFFYGDPDVLMYAYMDDLILGHRALPKLHQLMDKISDRLGEAGFAIAPEKVQWVPPLKVLGAELHLTAVRPLLPSISIPKNLEITQLQKVLGEINWLRPWVGVSTETLLPLFSLLEKGGPVEGRLSSQSNIYKSLINSLGPYFLPSYRGSIKEKTLHFGFFRGRSLPWPC